MDIKFRIALSLELIACVDGLTGFAIAIEALFSNTRYYRKIDI